MRHSQRQMLGSLAAIALQREQAALHQRSVRDCQFGQNIPQLQHRSMTCCAHPDCWSMARLASGQGPCLQSHQAAAVTKLQGCCSVVAALPLELSPQMMCNALLDCSQCLPHQSASQCRAQCGRAAAAVGRPHQLQQPAACDDALLYQAAQSRDWAAGCQRDCQVRQWQPPS